MWLLGSFLCSRHRCLSRLFGEESYPQYWWHRPWPKVLWTYEEILTWALALAESSTTIVSVPYDPSGRMTVLVIILGPTAYAVSLDSSLGIPSLFWSWAKSGRAPTFLFMVSKALSISFWVVAYSPKIHKATLITRWDLISSKESQIFSKIAFLCSGCTSITSLMKRIVSSDVNVERLSNIKKEFINGLRKEGIVSGKVYVSWLIDLINKYLYSLVVAAWSPDSSILRALPISFSRKVIISLIFLGEANSVVSSRTF